MNSISFITQLTERKRKISFIFDVLLGLAGGLDLALILISVIIIKIQLCHFISYIYVSYISNLAERCIGQENAV